VQLRPALVVLCHELVPAVREKPQDLEVAEPARPGDERAVGIVLVKFLPQVDRGLLDDLLGIVKVGHERQDVAQDLALRGGRQPDETFGLVSLRTGLCHGKSNIHRQESKTDEVLSVCSVYSPPTPPF
jgi:hypothetical protein